jgi:ADP-L-glycero-D-manno-heptose 6-epimerase
VSKFTWQIRKQGYLNLFEGSDNFLRDFVCVKDVVRLALYNNKPSGIYDLGTNNPVSFQYVAEQVAKKEGGEIRYVPFPDHLKGKYQDYTCANMSWIQEYPYITIPEYLQL